MLLLLSMTTVLLSIAAQHNLTPYGNATQSSSYLTAPINAIHPPIANTFSFPYCSLSNIQTTAAWWMFQFSFGTAYITDIAIYYRENYAHRMDGFKLYVTNTSTIPPDGYLCYEDPDPGLPNITQNIPCNQLGKYVIYFDDKGSQHHGPVVELCYVAINGCQNSFWGNNCDKMCSENCIERHCHPENGSCVWGCNTKHCLNDICDIQTAVCTDGCEPKRTGNYCSKSDILPCTRYAKSLMTIGIKYNNIASDGIVSQTPSGSQTSSLANDGNTKSCFKTKGTTVTFQVDLQKESIVTGVHIIFGESTTREGNHTLYASNTSTSWKSGTILYKETSLPSEIKLYAVFRYMTYESPVEGLLPELEVCEIGIVGCPPSHYGLLCNKWCPENCNGPCDLDTGKCIFSCLNGWHGDTCEQACEAGTYGKDCLATCSPHCLYPQCHGVTGECLVGCNDGWQGFNCSQRCSTGQFGRNCSMLCKGCVSRMCDPDNGLCDITTACNPGYINGQYCNTPCINGFYGINCHQVCSQLCLHKPCDRRTGECNGGCVHGIQGFNCTEVSSIKENVDSPVIIQVGLFAGGCLFGAVIATVVCCIIIKKRQERTKQGKENTTMETQRNELQHYDDVKMDNVSTYQEITTEQYDQINTAYINH